MKKGINASPPPRKEQKMSENRDPDKAYKNPWIGIEIIKSTDPSVQCIQALRQVMDYFEKGHLSPLGKDKKAVYAWFMQRYNQDISISTPEI